MSDVQFARMGLASLVLFRGILRDGTVQAFAHMLEAGDLAPIEQVGRCADFAARLLENGGDWGRYLLEQVLCDENLYIKRCGQGLPPDSNWEKLLEKELVILSAVGSITAADLEEEFALPVQPHWRTSPADYHMAFRKRMGEIAQKGYGIFARHTMFRLRDDELEPVLHPDPIRYEDLVGYEREREIVTANTCALLKGLPAANVLLYGDSGTGKSTCVKAVANELCGSGLRLIELRKDQLNTLPRLIDRLSGNPLKFILFIDDLSFAQNSDHFSSLKAVLEGSVSTKTANMVIYATSNRRHLVRETFTDRQGDEVHLRDTLEELSSLSDRFGLMVTFLRPDRALYLEIAGRYLRQYDIQLDADMQKRAEAFALRRGGRSARAARQFAEAAAAAGET